jgi:hypothetical protein
MFMDYTEATTRKRLQQQAHMSNIGFAYGTLAFGARTDCYGTGWLR